MIVSGHLGNVDIHGPILGPVQNPYVPALLHGLPGTYRVLGKIYSPLSPLNLAVSEGQVHDFHGCSFVLGYFLMLLA